MQVRSKIEPISKRYEPWSKVHKWKLHNNKSMTASTQITNTENFAIIAHLFY